MRGGWAASRLGLALVRGVDRQTRRMERKGLGLATEVWNSYFVIWNMSEISNEIWSITASHTSQWRARSVCACVCVCASGNVLSFLFWSTGALDGGRQRRRRGGELGGRGGLSTWTYWSFTVLSQVFFFSLFFICLAPVRESYVLYASTYSTYCLYMSIRVKACMASEHGTSFKILSILDPFLNLRNIYSCELPEIIIFIDWFYFTFWTKIFYSVLQACKTLFII